MFEKLTSDYSFRKRNTILTVNTLVMVNVVFSVIESTPERTPDIDKGQCVYEYKRIYRKTTRKIIIPGT